MRQRHDRSLRRSGDDRRGVEDRHGRILYAHSESLDLSGCVLAPSVERVYSQMKQHAVDAGYKESVRGMLDQLCVGYPIPKKGDGVETGLMMNWVDLLMRFFGGSSSDMRAYVYSSFVAHDKDAVPAIQPKIDSTGAFVRKVVENVEPRPWLAMSRRMLEMFRASWPGNTDE